MIGPFGSAFTVENYTQDRSFRYIRGKDVKPLRLMDNDNVYMPHEDYERLSKYALRENDILVSVVGTLGNAAIVTQKDLPAIFSCKSTVIRANTIDSKYLLAYLNSKYGRSLLLRKERGAIQKGLNLDDLKTLEVYIPSKVLQSSIRNAFDSALHFQEESKNYYSRAESILLNYIGYYDIELSTEKVNVLPFRSSFLATGRLDSEYYQKKYEQIVNLITNKKFAKLGSIVKIKKSIEPGSTAYSDEGYPFLRVSDYNKFGTSDPTKKLSSNFCAENNNQINTLKPKKGTILFSKDGSVGIAYMLRQDAEFITSGAILHLLMRDNSEIYPEYLTLVLNSPLVQMQAERDAGGSIILHWRTSEIEDVVIPIIDNDQQQEIVKLVNDSFYFKTKSEELLQNIKKAVELAIEAGEETALNFLKEYSF